MKFYSKVHNYFYTTIGAGKRKGNALSKTPHLPGDVQIFSGFTIISTATYMKGIIVKSTITWTSWMGEVTNLASGGGGWFAEQLSTYFRALL